MTATVRKSQNRQAPAYVVPGKAKFRKLLGFGFSALRILHRVLIFMRCFHLRTSLAKFRKLIGFGFGVFRTADFTKLITMKILVGLHLRTSLADKDILSV